MKFFIFKKNSLYRQVQQPKPVVRREEEEEERYSDTSDDSVSSGFLTHDTFDEHRSAKKAQAAQKTPVKRFDLYVPTYGTGSSFFL